MQLLLTPHGDPSDTAQAKPTKLNRHQLHLWIGEKDYRFLQKLAGREDEPMSRIVRRLIRQLRIESENHLL